MIVFIGKLPYVRGLKQLVAKRPDPSLRKSWLLVLIIILLRLYDIGIVSRIRLTKLGLLLACLGVLLLAVRLGHIAVRLLVTLIDCAPVVAHLLIVNLRLLICWFRFIPMLLLTWRFRGVDLHFNLMLIKIGFIVLDLVLNPTLNILEVVRFQRRGDCTLSL